MSKEHDANGLWVAISSYGEGNLFTVYPKLLAQLLRESEEARRLGDTSEAENLVLPSDKDWRLQQYFYLVSLQRNQEGLTESESTSGPPRRAEKEALEEWAPWNVVVSAKNPNAPPPVDVKTTPGPAWDIAQVLKAGRLMCKPPRHVDFNDEQEMRCVYSLIYDVYRFKSILDQAIEDINFFDDFPQFAVHRHLLWLFLMELARRRWAARPRPEAEDANRLLQDAGTPFKECEQLVWKQRVHFAASIARIRIKNRAFSLSELLPPHLREERISACVNKETVTGWVNTFKAKKVAVLVKKLHELGYSYSGSKHLCPGEYRFDRVCPRFITLRPPENANVAQMNLVKEGIIVLQEREFCEGASTLCRVLRANDIQGVVAQTHASSPRCSAYLAAQLRELAAVLRAAAPAAPAVPELGRLVVFGAGDKVSSYICALRSLGIEASTAPQSDVPVCVLSEAVHADSPAVLAALRGVVAVLATPPNSYSAVSDPIDLVCGQGGDLAMLEVLTESVIDVHGKARVHSILEEQKKTLKTLMSKPQIQIILYETHSALEAENQAQVNVAIDEANRLATERHNLLNKKPVPKEKHAETAVSKHSDIMSDDDSTSSSDIAEKSVKVQNASRPGSTQGAVKSRPFSAAQSRPQSAAASVLTKTADGSQSKTGKSKARPIPETKPTEQDHLPEDLEKEGPEIVVPDCDLFEVGKLPNLGNGLDLNFILDRDGCYLSLIQRREITRLDAKYMIRIAEERGLFGSGSPTAKGKKKDAPPPPPAQKRRHRKHSFEVRLLERVSAPTYASMSRSRRGSAGGGGGGRGGCGAAGELAGEGELRHVCSRHARRQFAAAAYTHAACTCNASHRESSPRGGSWRAGSAPPPPCCRHPFPVAVQDLRLVQQRYRRSS